jgi:CheY-like chemotaxis protein
MKPTDAAALITAVSGIIWPIVGLALLWVLRNRFATLIDSISQRGGGVKLGGFEVSVAEATAQQQKLIGDLQVKLASLEDKLQAISKGTGIAPTDVTSGEAVGSATTEKGPTAIPGEGSKIDLSAVAAARSIPQGTTILWVDGHPEAAAALIDTIEARGARVTKALTVSDALDTLANHEYAVIIARMSINGQSDAGVDLVRRVRRIDPLATIYLLTGTRGAERYGKEALVCGAHFVTDSPAELIRQLTRLH